MGDFPVAGGDRFRGVVISTRDTSLGIGESLLSMNCSGASNYGAGAWPVANLAIFVPFIAPHPLTVVKMGVSNGAAVSGNVDTGIYDFAGNLLVSAGSTAQAGTSTTQVFDVTDTKLAGGRYFLAIALNNATGQVLRFTPTAVGLGGLGVLQMAAAFPLPSSATFAAMAQNYLPLGFATARVLI